MREILFRGKRIDNGEWVDGFLLKTYKSTLITKTFTDDGLRVSMLEGYDVDPETVSQYTGLKDKKGHLIFEGDLLEIDQSSSKNTIARVKYLGSSFGLVRPKYHNTVIAEVIYYAQFNTIIIGNIHDNPELLERRHD